MNSTTINNDLLEYFQQELTIVRQLANEFAEKHPKAAARLGLASTSTEDPHVAQLLESFALSNARLRHNLADDYPEISTAILDILHTHFLAPIPAMSIAQFISDPTKLITSKTIPAGTFLRNITDNRQYGHFKTCYPVTILPIIVQEAQLFSKPLIAPPIPQLNHITSVLRISLNCTQNKLTFSELGIDSIRFFINAEPQYAYAFYELLFKHTKILALADSATDLNPIIINRSDLKAVGFDTEQGMLPYHPRTPIAYRLLTEFFSFPEKFLFFDIMNLQDKINHKFSQPNKPLEIFFYLDNTNPLLEKHLNQRFLALGCAPIINLFEKRTKPIALTLPQNEYQLIPDTQHPPATTEIYAVQQVIGTTQQGAEIIYQPFYALNQDLRNHHYVVTRKPAWHGEYYLAKGTAVFLIFSDIKWQTTDNLSICANVLCFNQDLQIQSKAELSLVEGKFDELQKITCLLPTTPSRWPACNKLANWHIISHLSLNHFSLTDDEEGIMALRNILALYDFDKTELQEGLLHIQRNQDTRRNPNNHAGNNVFWQGSVIILQVDESRFTRTSLFLFGCILERFFALYTTNNFFTELTIINKSREVFYTWEPRRGEKSSI